MRKKGVEIWQGKVLLLSPMFWCDDFSASTMLNLMPSATTVRDLMRINYAASSSSCCCSCCSFTHQTKRPPILMIVGLTLNSPKRKHFGNCKIGLNPLCCYFSISTLNWALAFGRGSVSRPGAVPLAYPCLATRSWKGGLVTLTISRKRLEADPLLSNFELKCGLYSLVR